MQRLGLMLAWRKGGGEIQVTGWGKEEGRRNIITIKNKVVAPHTQTHTAYLTEKKRTFASWIYTDRVHDTTCLTCHVTLVCSIYSFMHSDIFDSPVHAVSVHFHNSVMQYWSTWCSPSCIFHYTSSTPLYHHWLIHSQYSLIFGSLWEVIHSYSFH